MHLRDTWERIARGLTEAQVSASFRNTSLDMFLAGAAAAFCAAQDDTILVAWNELDQMIKERQRDLREQLEAVSDSQKT